MLSDSWDDYIPSILLVILILTFLLCVTFIVKSRFKYWQIRNVPYIQPSFPFGNFENILISKKPQSIIFQEFYEHFSTLGVKYGGIYSFCTPTFLPIDPEIIKCILTKDVQHFLARGFYANEKDQPISAHLFSLDGTKWKTLRGKLTSTFTAAKLKDMFPIFQHYGDDLKTYIKNSISKLGFVNLRETTYKYTADIITSCAFGLESDCLKSENENEMIRNGHRATHETCQLIKGTFCFAFPNLAKKIGVKIFSADTENFFKSIVSTTVNYRTKNNVRRNDLLQTLIDMLDKESSGGLTMDEITAQCLLFYIAGFETSATTLMFALFELAQNEVCQLKLKKEMQSVMKEFHGELTYDIISEMKYLDQIVKGKQISFSTFHFC